jgi:hypothetical protein
MNPVSTLYRAATMPMKAVFVVGLCLVINWMTTPGHWWVQWVALGMGIAVLSAWYRAAKVAVAGGVLAVLAAWAYRRWGVDLRR